jgi:nucleotide-binding universal stress UspA family protein
MKDATAFPRRIVGVDGSDASIVALRWAAQRRAEDGSATLVLAHVDAEGARSAQEASSVLDDAHALVDAEYPGTVVETRSLAGPVGRALGEAADPDDVLVIGTDKTGLLHGRVSGALSIQLAMTAPCAVAVVPDLDLSFRRGVVAGIGRPDSAVRVATAAWAQARHLAAPLTLVHGGCTEHCTDGLDAAEQHLLGRDPELSIRRRILSTAAADALLDTALDKELLVLGRASRSASGAPIGAVTHTVLMNATSPILLLGPS